MRVFLDTNVLASAFGTRGLCADILRLILEEHELVTGEVVIEELRRVLQLKFRAPAATVREVEEFLRGYHVEAKPRILPRLAPNDRNDVAVIASVLNARGEILITGDKEMLALRERPAKLQIMNPREWWSFTSKKQRTRE